MSKFKVGDKVKVVRKVEKEEGWKHNWVLEMDEMLGNIYEVIQVYQYSGIALEDNYGWEFVFPPSSLELVEDNSMKTFANEDKIRFKDLTAEQQHIIIEGIDRGNVECYDYQLGKWVKHHTTYIQLNNRYRIKPTKQLVIPWEYIKPEFKYAAMDKNGRLFAYPTKPYIEGNYWVIDNSQYAEYIGNAIHIDTNGVDWENSLVKRPD